MLYASKEHQSSLGHIGKETEPSNHTSETCGAFMCVVYTAVNVAWTKVNDVRDWMFCQKGQRNENLLLRPTSYSSIRNEDNALQPVVMTKEPAPRCVPELSVCHCKKSSYRRADCACRTNSMPCTEAWACMAGENYQNPHSTRPLTDDEDTELTVHQCSTARCLALKQGIYRLFMMDIYQCSLTLIISGEQL